ncbi:DUF1513 domain-containing protein [Vibrio lentus]|nr:DUF1513 domain-containing protein [Vibrio lentus]
MISVYDVAQGYRRSGNSLAWYCGPRRDVMPDGNLAIGVGGVHTDGRTPENLDFKFSRV